MTLIHLIDGRGVAFLDANDVIEAHAIVLETMGVARSGLRSREILEGALSRVPARAHYGDVDIVRLAVITGLAISQAHAFIDGNKRTAYMAIIVFLEINDEPILSPVWTEERSTGFARLIERYAMAHAERDETEATMVAFLAETLAAARRG